MSAIHFVDVTIDVEFNIALHTVLNRCLEEGCTYFINDSSATIEEVISKFRNPTEEDIDDGGPSVHVIYHDTIFTLWIKPSSNRTDVHIGCFSEPWVNEYSDDSNMTYIDFGRYTRLLLKLCDPFPIVSIDSGDI